jgi:hypothetical protein
LDACGGTADAPSVTWYACDLSNGAAQCVASETAEADACSDAGSDLGGGACTASDWACTDGLLTSKGTSGADTCGGTADAPAVTWWSCEAGDGSAADRCVEAETVKSDACTDSGDAFGAGVCAATDWTCSGGLLTSASTSGADTCGGTVDAPSVQYYACVAGDGSAADRCDPGVTERFDVCTDTGSGLGGGSCLASDWSCEGGMLTNAETEGLDACGGTPDAPAVTYYACAAFDGTGDDLCVAAETAKADDCTDTGDELGGGACSASDWSCEQGLLTLTETSGTDVCGGDADSPSVTFHGCSANDGTSPDRCAAQVTTRTDSCMDSGTASGGGTCEATDWSCTGGVLGGSLTAGTDTCGDGSESQTGVWECAAAAGALADTCVLAPDTAPPVFVEPEDVTVELATAHGTEVTLTVTPGDVCDDSLAAVWTEDGATLATGPALTHVFTLGEHHVMVTVTDDAGNATSAQVVVTVLDSCGNGSIDLYRGPEPPPCASTKWVKVDTRAQLDAWLADPTAPVRLRGAMDFGGEDLTIATACELQIDDAGALTGLAHATIMAADIDVKGAVAASGRVELRAQQAVALGASASLVGAGSLVIEASHVDDHASLAFRDTYCVEADSDVRLHTVSRTTEGGTVRVRAGTLDWKATVEGASRIELAASGDATLGEGASLTSTGDITLLVGGKLDLKADIAGATLVSISAAEATVGGPSELANTGDLTIEVEGALTLRGLIAQAAEVTLSASTFELGDSAWVGPALGLTVVAKGPEVARWRGDAAQVGDLVILAPSLELSEEGSIDTNGNVVLDITTWFDAKGSIRNNGDVLMVACNYKLRDSHDFQQNVSCTLEGAADPKSKPAKGCTELPAPPECADAPPPPAGDEEGGADTSGEPGDSEGDEGEPGDSEGDEDEPGDSEGDEDEPGDSDEPVKGGKGKGKSS